MSLNTYGSAMRLFDESPLERDIADSIHRAQVQDTLRFLAASRRVARVPLACVPGMGLDTGGAIDLVTDSEGTVFFTRKTEAGEMLRWWLFTVDEQPEQPK